MVTSLLSVCHVLISHGEIHSFDTLPCPRGAPQKFEARGNTGVVREASNVNLLAQGLPSIERNQFSQELVQGDAMKRIVGLNFIHVRNLDTGSLESQYSLGHGVSRLIKLVGVSFG